MGDEHLPTQRLRRLIATAIGTAVISALIIWGVSTLLVRDLDRFDSQCPEVDGRLNAYERELQERECEARLHR